MQKRLGILGIFLIVLMFVFSSGFVFADDFQRLKINSINYDSHNNKLIVEYLNSKTPSFDNGNSLLSRFTIFSNSYEINEENVPVNYFVLYVKKKLTNDEKENLQKTISSLLYKKDITKAGGYLTLSPFIIFDLIKEETYDRSKTLTYQTSCYDNRLKLKKEFSNQLNINSNDVIISCGSESYKSNNLIVEYDNLDDTGTFIVVLIRYKVTKNQGPLEYETANLISFEKYKNRYKGFFIEDEEDLFNSRNYFAAIDYLDLSIDEDDSAKESENENENENKNDISLINLDFEIVEDSKIKLISNVEDANIYYTLEDFNLNNYFNTDLESIKSSPDNLDSFKDVENRISQIKKYTSPVSLSSGQKLNAIAVDFKNLVLSNYLEGITLSSSEKSDSSQSSSESSSSNKFSINFKEDIKTDNVICEKETKICYVKFNQNIDLDLIANKVNDGNVYFAINNLTKNFTEINFNDPTSTLLSSNEINLGDKLRFYNSNNKEFKINLNQNSNNSFVLAAGQKNTNVDYLFFVFLSDLSYSDLVNYKILQKIVNDAYCTTFDCKIPDWMPYNILTPAYQDPVCEEIIKDDGKVEKESCKSRENPKLEFSCDVYTSNLRKNLNIFNLTQNTGGRSYGDILTSQMNNITINPNNQSKFNDVVLDVSKGYKLTDEETVQFISILAQESTFGTKVEGGLNEFGFAQIHSDAWFGDSTKISNGKNQLKSYFEIILNNKNSLSDETIKNITTTDALYDYVKQTIDYYKLNKSPDNLNKMNYATTVFGGAIYLYNRDQILNNGQDFPIISFSTYDDKDSIDALFASASKYVTPKTGFNIRAIMIAGGLITPDNALKTIYKMAYYLSYKKYICENENNFFNITLNKSVSNTTSTSTNVDLSGVLPVKKNLTDEQIKNELLGKTEYQNYCATFAREAGNYIFNYSPPLQSNNAWYFGESNQVILKVDNETQINPNNLVPGSILGIKIGDKDFYDTKEDGRLTNLPYTHVVLYVGNFDGKQNVVFDGGWTNNNVKSFYKTFDQYFNDHPTYDLKEVILPKGSVTDEQKAYLSDCIKSKTKTCEYYT